MGPVKRPCLGPGPRPCPTNSLIPVTEGSRCEACKKARYEAGLTGARGSRGNWKSLRRTALKRDGHRCTAMVWDGRRKKRCPATVGLEAHHVNGDATDNRLANLTTLCAAHHKAAHR